MLPLRSALSLLLVVLLPSAAAAQEGNTAPPLARGERLLGELHCTACHSAPEAVVARLAPQLAPALNEVAGRVSPAFLRDYLADPFATSEHNRMPNLVAKLGEDERDEVIEGLVHFLATLGEPAGNGRTSALVHSVERGRRLFHEVGCVACHTPHEEPWELEVPLMELYASSGEEEPDEEASEEDNEEDDEELYLPDGTLSHPAVPLNAEWLARKTTVSALSRFLLDPLAVRPSGRMPSLSLSEHEAEDIARYLLREQSSLGAGFEEAPGLAYEYFEESFQQRPPEWDSWTPANAGVADSFRIDLRERDDHFGFRFSGLLVVPTAGSWTLHLSSDDGSMLYLDGELLIDHGGVHGTTTKSAECTLEAGRHSIVVTMFEVGGGEALQVEWEGPGTEREDIPADALKHSALGFVPPVDGFGAAFEIDRALARRGAGYFKGLGCSACHETGRAELDEALPSGTAKGPALFDLDVDGLGQGCLAPSEQGGPVRFPLVQDDLVAVRVALGEARALAAPREPAVAVAHALDRLNCYACHRRDGVGGPHPMLRDYFVADEDAELGDEGRVPPPLSYVGAKLREQSLRDVLLHGEAVRPYMATRMPQFGEQNVGQLVELFAAADPLFEGFSGKSFDPELIRTGHQLAGTENGLGCIQCHTFGGRPSLGVQAVDLVGMHERLHEGWFRELLLDPKALEMNTRMPAFWLDGKSPVDVFDGDPARQTEALWTYLSMGSGMALPKGLSTPDAAFELVPTGDPVTCGVFMRNVGPRTLVVGFPELYHYAFDMESARLASWWRGRFFNARGTWQGRAGQLESPPSDQVLLMPKGPSFARLADVTSPWPVDEDTTIPLSRRFDAERRPVFRYRTGEVTIEERPRPELTEDGGKVVREFRVTALRPVNDLWLRAFEWTSGGAAWRAPEVAEDGSARYTVDGQTITLRVIGAARPIAVVGEGVELMIPVKLLPLPGTPPRFEARFEVEMSW